MSSINWDSILKKAQAYMGTTRAKKQVDSVVSDFILGKIKLADLNVAPISPDEVADMFIKILRDRIRAHAIGETFTTSANGGLGKTALEALDDIVHDKPVLVKDGSGKYEIAIRFAGERHRESLVPDRYDGVDNIMALLNTGYEAGKVVRGVWEGHSDQPIPSLRRRTGAFFIQEAKREFLDRYAQKFGTINNVSVEINDEYE